MITEAEIMEGIENPPASQRRLCEKCGAEFETRMPKFAFFKLCPKCNLEREETEKAKELASQIASRRECWNLKCPKLFQETVKEKLPFPGKAEEVLTWKFDRRGLLLYGKTRVGKSRCAWLLCQKLFVEKMKDIEVMDSSAGFEYASLFSGSPESAYSWIKKKSQSHILLLDDVFKSKLTDSFEAALFAIIDNRVNSCLPIIATLNDTGKTLLGRMSIDRGSALVARLKESCKTIVFA